MALDGLNGFGFVYENAGYTSPYASTGFTAPEGYKTPGDELQTELTGKKKKAGKPKKAVKPKKASVPRPKVNYNGTVTYGSLTFKNVEEFKRAFPEIKVPKAIASRVKTPPVVTPAPQTYYEYLMEKINGGKQPALFTPPFEQPLEQPILQPIEQSIDAGETQKAPKVTADEIKKGPHKGKFGVFVNGKLQENQVFDSMEEASKASTEIEKKVNDPAERSLRRGVQKLESNASKASRYGQRTVFNPETGMYEATNTIEGQQAREIGRMTTSQAEMDALQPYERGLKTKPQVVETPIVIEGSKPNGSTIEFNAEPAINAPRPNVGVIMEDAGAEAEGLGRVIVEDAGAEAEGLGRVVAEDAGAEAEGLGRVVAEDAGAGTRAGAEAGAEAGAKAGSKSFFKSGKGKAALVLGGLALVGAALFGLSKCEGDKKQQLPPANPEPEKKPEPKPQPEKPAQPAQPAQPKQNQKQQPKNTEVSAVKGSHEWGYAELELISEHLGQAGYRPTNQEITDRMMQIIERENKAIESAKANDPEGKNRHSVPTLKVGDDLKVSPKLKKVIDEATAELKEAHKDNPNYKVTWTELRAKVQEKLAA